MLICIGSIHCGLDIFTTAAIQQSCHAITMSPACRRSSISACNKKWLFRTTKGNSHKAKTMHFLQMCFFPLLCGALQVVLGAGCKITFVFHPLFILKSFPLLNQNKKPFIPPAAWEEATQNAGGSDSGCLHGLSLSCPLYKGEHLTTAWHQNHFQTAQLYCLSYFENVFMESYKCKLHRKCEHTLCKCRRCSVGILSLNYIEMNDPLITE